MSASIGRIVRYGVSKGKDGVIYRPAVIVHVWPDEAVDLQIFLNGGRDEERFTPEETHRGLARRTSVYPGSDVGQWSWPTRA